MKGNPTKGAAYGIEVVHVTPAGIAEGSKRGIRRGANAREGFGAVEVEVEVGVGAALEIAGLTSSAVVSGAVVDGVASGVVGLLALGSGFPPARSMAALAAASRGVRIDCDASGFAVSAGIAAGPDGAADTTGGTGEGMLGPADDRPDEPVAIGITSSAFGVDIPVGGRTTSSSTGKAVNVGVGTGSSLFQGCQTPPAMNPGKTFGPF